MFKQLSDSFPNPKTNPRKWWKLTLGLSLFTIMVCIGIPICGTIIVGYLNQTRIVEVNFPLRQRWAFETDEQIGATPVVYGDKILVRTLHHLYVIRALDGELLWTYTLLEDMHVDPPLVQNNIVVFTHPKGITALDLNTEEVLWEVNQRSPRADALPAVANDELVVIVDAAIFALDIETGELIWKINNPYARSNTIVALDDKNLYLVFADQIHNYNVETGKLIWEQPTQEWALPNSLSGHYNNGVLFLERHEDDGIAAFSVRERKILWERNDVSLSGYPMMAEDDVLFLSSRGDVPVALDVSDGEILWKATGVWNGDNYQKPLSFGDKIFVRGLFQKKIYALEKSSGEMVGYVGIGIPDIVSANASYSLGPVEYDDMIIFPANKKLLAYGK